MHRDIQLTEVEHQRLSRILAYENLEKQRNVAIPFFVLAGLVLIALPGLSRFEATRTLIALPLSMALLFVGAARLGYYKLFRLIQYLGGRHDPQRVSGH